MQNSFKTTFFLILLATSAMAQSPFDKMTNEKMHKVIVRESKEYKGDKGNWQVKFKERILFIITDENANRMRIMTPIIEEKEMEDGELKIMMEANFDRALDAKYALFNNYVWSVFTHPLGELTVAQFIDATEQVEALGDNYRGSYTSTNMVFGGGQQAEDGN